MKVTLVALFILFSLSCQEKEVKKTNNAIVIYPDKELPVLRINKDTFTKIDTTYFNHSVGGKPIKEETLVSMKYDNEFLEIKFECRNNPRLDQNSYTKDNSWLFKQEVFELFISKGKETKENYLEIQLNPNNALFLAKITNRYKSDKKFALDLVDIATSGIIHTVKKDSENKAWIGYLKIPLGLLQYPKTTIDNVYRLNMFRIISNEDHKSKDWSVTEKNATFACWSSTMGETPNFHAPDFFGYLILE